MNFNWIYDKRKLNDELFDADKKTPQELISLIRKGADIHYNDDCALRICASYGLYENVRVLISLGANISVLNNEPLIMAISSYRSYSSGVKRLGEKSNYVKTVKILLDAGSNVNANNGEPLKFACIFKNEQIINLLLEYGAYPLTARGSIPNKKIAELLISQKPDPWKDNLRICSQIQKTRYHKVKTVDPIKNSLNDCDVLFIDIDNTLFCTFDVKEEFMTRTVKVLTDAWWLELLNTTDAYICIVTSRTDYNPITQPELENFGVKYDVIYFTNYNDRMKVEIYAQVTEQRGAKNIVVVDDMEEILDDAYNKFIDDESIGVTLFKWIL